MKRPGLRGRRTPTLGELVAIAGQVLEKAGELPPLTLTCLRHERSLPAITVTSALLWMSMAEQANLPRVVATRLGWSLQRLDSGEGYAAAATVDGVTVQALAAPLSSGVREPASRTSDLTTAAHSDLLRALVDWAASLPAEAIALEVREDLDGAGQFTVRLVLPRGFDVTRIAELVMPGPTDDGWSGYRGAGVLPTGHALTVSVER